MKADRVFFLDVVRLLACCMVVLMHSPMPTVQENSLVTLVISYVTAPCIGLFFMVSGALLLPVKADAKDFLKKRLGKVLFPTLIWSLFYILVKIVNTGSHDLSSIARQVLSIPFSAQGSGVMWFMYTLTGLYVVAPVISPWLETVKKSTLELYIVLWLLTMCFPLFEIALDVNSGVTGLYYYIAGYIGYFVLGYYLRKYGAQCVRLKVVLPLFCLSILMPVLFWYFELKVDFYRVFWYLSLFVAVQAVFWFRLCQKYIKEGGGKEKLMARLSNLSFGIYLIHIFIMRELVWKLSWVEGISNYVLQVVIIFLITMGISLAVTYIIALLSGGDYIIGYRIKKK